MILGDIWDLDLTANGSLKQQNRATAPNDLPPQRLSLPLPHQIRSTGGETRTQHARRVTFLFAAWEGLEMGY